MAELFGYDLIVISTIIAIVYLVAMIIGTILCRVYMCDNLLAAVIAAWLIIPGTGTIWIPCLSHILL